MEILNIISNILKPAADLVDNVSTTDEERLQLRNELKKIESSVQNEMMQLKAGAIKAEALSGNKLASSWRPMLMYVFMTLIVFNYILIPIINLLGGAIQPFLVPGQMWNMITISLTGYVGARSAEKIAGRAGRR